MSRFRPAVAAVSLMIVAAAGCGSSGSAGSAAPAGAAGSGAAASTRASATASSPAHPSDAGTSAAAASGSTAPSGASVATSSTAAGSSKPVQAGSDALAPLPPAGTYRYHLSGKSTSAFGSTSYDETTTQTVDRPAPNRAHSSETDQGATTEETLVARSDGVYLTDLHISQTGFNADFKPIGSALLYPGHIARGQKWHWSLKSSDGAYTLHAQFVVTDSNSSTTTADGQRVATVSVAGVLHIDGSTVNLTIHQQDQATRGAVIVREHAVTDGTAYGTKVHNDARRVLLHQPS